MSTRIIHDVVLTVAPGEVDDPQRAKRFILTWWEKKAGWSFCHKNLGEEGRALSEKAPSDPEVLALILGKEDVAVFSATASDDCSSCGGSGSQGPTGCTDCLGTGVDPMSARALGVPGTSNDQGENHG